MHEPSNIYKYKQIDKQRHWKNIFTQKHKKTKKERWEYLPLLGLWAILAPRANQEPQG